MARLIADTSLLVRARRGDVGWLDGEDLEPLERQRLTDMAVDDRMEVLCSLYRSNRLTALVRTVPEVVEALGEGLGAVVSEYWRITPRTDLQFRSEGAAFCRYVSATTGDARLAAIADDAERALADRYGVSTVGR